MTSPSVMIYLLIYRTLSNSKNALIIVGEILRFPFLAFLSWILFKSERWLCYCWKIFHLNERPVGGWCLENDSFLTLSPNNRHSCEVKFDAGDEHIHYSLHNILPVHTSHWYPFRPSTVFTRSEIFKVYSFPCPQLKNHFKTTNTITIFKT